MVTYKDIQEAEEGKKLLDDKRAEHKAMSILNDQMFNEEQEVIDLEAQAEQEGADVASQEVDQVAREALDMMENLEAQGQDPMVVLSQLPPEVQQRITAILDSEEAALMNDNGVSDNSQPQQQQPMNQGSGDAMSDLVGMATNLAS